MPKFRERTRQPDSLRSYPGHRPMLNDGECLFDHSRGILPDL